MDYPLSSSSFFLSFSSFFLIPIFLSKNVVLQNGSKVTATGTAVYADIDEAVSKEATKEKTTYKIYKLETFLFNPSFSTLVPT